MTCCRPRDQTLPKPSNADQFLRIWKKQCPEQAAKLQLLLICSSVELHKWFKHGISADLLSEILVVCGYTLKEITAALNATDSMRAPPPSADAESSAWECEPCSTANFVYKLLQVLAGEALMFFYAWLSILDCLQVCTVKSWCRAW